MSAVRELTAAVGVSMACQAMGVSRSGFYRQQRPAPAKATGVARTHPRALSPTERTEVLAVLHGERHCDRSPGEIYATLLDEGRYLCSVRTMYRLLAQDGPVRERRAQRRHPVYAKPQLLATAPNQVWTWDLTKLKGPGPWQYYHLYVVMDLFSRYVVGWMLAHRESGVLARRLIQQALAQQRIAPGQLTVHADRGAAPSVSRRRSAQREGNPPAPLVGGRLEALVGRQDHGGLQAREASTR
ncbi:MAG: DDE-type integrase/transposase/recombinase [Gammaproteobacteria bacterium]